MLLFIHGFLGQKEDWKAVISHLPPGTEISAIDLPGHGDCPYEKDACRAIRNKAPSADIVVGYSAGGRLALELQNAYPNSYKRVIAISAHPGLSEEERIARMKIDAEWVEMLKTAPLEKFLKKWYAQPLFHSLICHPEFYEIIERRQRQNLLGLAAFLEENSIAKKTTPEISESTIFVYGSQDLKYAELYRKLSSNRVIGVKQAGHALHLEAPIKLAEIIQGAIDEHH